MRLVMKTEYIFIGTEWDVICYVNFRVQFVTMFLEIEFQKYRCEYRRPYGHTTLKFSDSLDVFNLLRRVVTIC